MEQWCPAPDRMAAVRVGHLLANDFVAKEAAADFGLIGGRLCLGDLRHTVLHAASHGLVSGGPFPSSQVSKHLAGGGHAGHASWS